MSLPKFTCEIAFGNRPGDTENSVVVGTIPVGTAPAGCAVTPDGSHLYVTNLTDGTVSVIATASNTVVATVTVGRHPGGIAVTPDGAHVYVANVFDGTVSVIATATNTVVTTISVSTVVLDVAITPDGAHVYVTDNSSPGHVKVIATASNTVTTTVTVGNGPQGIAVTPDGAHVYVANQAGTVSVIATATNTVSATITVGTAPLGVAITPDGAHVYVSNFSDDTVSVIATSTNTVVATVTVGIGPEGLAVSADGAHVYVANGGSTTISVIATATNTVSSTITVGTAPVAIAITPDDLFVYAVSQLSNNVSAIALATVVWTDVSAYLRLFNYARGRQYELNQMSAGTGTITLRNLDRRFDPTNTAGPYYPNVTPIVPIRILATLDATTYPIFTGYVQRWPQNRTGPTYAEVQVDVVDGFELLTNATLPTPGSGSYPQELSGSRVARVLNAIGWSASARNISTGQLPQISSLTFTYADAISALDHLLEVAENGEIGLFFIANDGTATFIDRHAQYGATSLGTFSDEPSVDAGAIGYTDIVATLDKDLIFNNWVGTRSGGTPQQAQDSTSIEEYFTRTQTRTPPLPTDADVLNQMKYLLAIYKNPALRIESITLNPGSTSASWVHVLQREIGDRITVRAHPPGGGSPIVQDAFIQQINLSIPDPHAASAKLTWQLLPAAQLGFWRAGYSAVGTDTRASW